MTTIHSELRRKEDRKIYKEKIFDNLTEWIYPSQSKEEIFEKLENLFANLKDCNTSMLKKLDRNCQMLFPVKFSDINPLIIREKLYKLYEEGIAREDIAQIELRIKGHFLDEPLEVVVRLATDIFNTVKDQNLVDVIFFCLIFDRNSSDTNPISSMNHFATSQQSTCFPNLMPIRPLSDRKGLR